MTRTFKVGPLLEKLRWKADTKIVNAFGEHVWLKRYYNREGKRIGITDCCFVNDPCPRHAKMLGKN